MITTHKNMYLVNNCNGLWIRYNFLFNVIVLSHNIRHTILCHKNSELSSNLSFVFTSLLLVSTPAYELSPSNYAFLAGYVNNTMFCCTHNIYSSVVRNSKKIFLQIKPYNIYFTNSRKSNLLKYSFINCS